MTKNSNGSTAPVEPALVPRQDNVTDETARKHFGRIFQLETKLAGVRGELAAAWKEAESDGIEKKPFKAAMKLLNADPATADAYLRKLQTYTTQLGLFDKIDAWKQAETNEANAASVDRAEEDLERQAGSGEPKSGGALDAAYAQGFEAGSEDAARTDNPYTDDDAHDAWDRGYLAGLAKLVDERNSARADAGVA